ncbi:hypothetical protein CUJ84_Chr001217 [Rhizobium leguminosarum]|uniref:Uncharacterized protein n=1 Tax=Rhizobium leguminosarum TaxID=384 RepID=A0A2K9Z053_RHILE|nr:hypothetical protein CUJ84_Chr001217 [Rhizobium leguminosarum]
MGVYLNQADLDLIQAGLIEQLVLIPTKVT